MTACKFVPVIDESLCTGCRTCLEACDRDCLDISWGIAVLTDPHYCGSDGHCVKACPENAMELKWLPLDGEPTAGLWSSAEQQQDLCG